MKYKEEMFYLTTQKTRLYTDHFFSSLFNYYYYYLFILLSFGCILSQTLFRYPTDVSSYPATWVTEVGIKTVSFQVYDVEWVKPRPDVCEHAWKRPLEWFPIATHY